MQDSLQDDTQVKSYTSFQSATNKNDQKIRYSPK